MSDPTYRIDVEHDPHMPQSPWYVKIYSLADAAFARATAHHRTTEEAQTWASEWVASETRRQNGFTFFTDDEGRPVEGHSVKASQA